MTNVCIIATIVIYLVGMLLVGFVYSKSNEDSTDFYLGGRKMGPLVTAMSAEASDMSSWLLMGLPGLAYLTGIASPGWTAIGLAVGTWLNWLIVARRLRRYSANLDAITVPQFLSLRFHDQRNLLNALGAVIIIVFFIPYTASGFAACGKLFHSLFGVDYMAAMVVSACVIVGYTITGGFRAVTTTDLIQSVVMSLALVAVLVYGIGAAGGWDAVVANAQSLPGYLTMMASHNAAEGTATSYSLLDIVSTMAWGLVSAASQRASRTWSRFSPASCRVKTSARSDARLAIFSRFITPCPRSSSATTGSPLRALTIRSSASRSTRTYGGATQMSTSASATTVHPSRCPAATC